ncbi:MAG: LamG domain-containing protein [Bryobacteraceae bacterium]|nr:LamG domain-containing protein [Bryobacteraceae bacterium]
MRYCLFFSVLSLLAQAAEPLFHASFNRGVDAERSPGDKRIHSAPDYKSLAAAKPGLAGTGVVHENGALHFTQKTTQAVFFPAQGLSPVTGTISFFLQLDPKLDLAPGYVDPLQLTDKAYNDSALWVDYTKDERFFRLGVFGQLKVWNPKNTENNPDFDKRLVVVKEPVFARGKWTHVAIVYQGLGTGKGVAKLYVDGKLQGSSPVIGEPFTWESGKPTLRLGVQYTGWIDEVAVYAEALSAGEIAKIRR